MRSNRIIFFIPCTEIAPALHLLKAKSERESARHELASRLHERPRSKDLFRRLYSNAEVTAYLNMANSMAVKRLGYNDHGVVHAAISARNAVKLLDLIAEKVPPTIVKEKEGDIDDSTLITIAGAYLHDIGNAVHRQQHQVFSVALAAPIVKRFTRQIYGAGKKAIQIECEILNAIYSHEENVRAVTVEAGCVRVGDGADMEKGRARYPYDRGTVDIHSLSALSVQKVEILPGQQTPALIRIHSMSTAGIFQVEKVLGEKIRTSGIAQYITVQTLVDGRDSGFRLHLS